MPTATIPLSFLLSSSGIFYAVSLPFFLLLTFTLVILVSASAGAKVTKAGQAAFHYLMQGVGILLMTAGAIPTLLSVLAGPPYSGRIYLSLLWMFLVGGALFLWHEQCTQRIERASTVVAHTIFVAVLKAMGYLVALFALLTLLTTVALGKFDPNWWVSPVVFLLYGVLLFWSTHEEEISSEALFRSTTLHAVVKPAAKKAKKPHAHHRGLGLLKLLKKWA